MDESNFEVRVDRRLRPPVGRTSEMKRIEDIVRKIGPGEKELANEVYRIETLLSQVKKPPTPAPLTRYEMIKNYGRATNVHLVAEPLKKEWLGKKQIDEARGRLRKAKNLTSQLPYHNSFSKYERAISAGNIGPISEEDCHSTFSDKYGSVLRAEILEFNQALTAPFLEEFVSKVIDIFNSINTQPEREKINDALATLNKFMLYSKIGEWGLSRFYHSYKDYLRKFHLFGPNSAEAERAKADSDHAYREFLYACGLINSFGDLDTPGKRITKIIELVARLDYYFEAYNSQGNFFTRTFARLKGNSIPNVSHTAIFTRDDFNKLRAELFDYQLSYFRKNKNIEPTQRKAIKALGLK